jgi:hypothetical protein
VVERGFYWGFACLLMVICGEVVVNCVVKVVRKQPLFNGLNVRQLSELYFSGGNALPLSGSRHTPGAKAPHFMVPLETQG